MPEANLVVIIPFFQREPGLLRRAVESIFAQRIGSAVNVIVIDDGSPVRAAGELVGLLDRPKGPIKLIERTNGGVATARNAGLEAVPSSTRYVAFLDSDDKWGPIHLEKMCRAFDQGADFYFSDYHSPNEALSSFAQNSRGRLSSERPLDSQRELYWLPVDLFDLTLKNSPIGLSTVGYRFELAADIRFPTAYRRACEDRMFFAELSRRVSRPAFSTAIDVTYGTGVNIFKSAAYGSLAGAERIRDSARFHVEMAVRFPLTVEQCAWNRGALASLDDQFVETVLISLLKCGQTDCRLLKSYLAMRPMALRRIPPVLALALARKFKPRAAAGGGI